MTILLRVKSLLQVNESVAKYLLRIFIPRRFSLMDCRSLVAGLAEETSTGSIGEVVDMKTLRGYRDRLQEIDRRA